MDALNHMDLPPGHGSKKTKPTQRRKGATNKKKRKLWRAILTPLQLTIQH